MRKGNIMISVAIGAVVASILAALIAVGIRNRITYKR